MIKIVDLSKIKSILPKVDLINEIEKGFVAYSNGEVVVPPVGELSFDSPPGDVHIKYGYIKNDDIYVIKIASGFYKNSELNLPTGNGMIMVFDQKNGQPIAVLNDECYLTDVRTAIAGAIAAKHLSNPDSTKAGIIGAGIQAKLQLEALTLVRNIDTAFIWARNSDKVNQFIKDVSKLNINYKVCSSPEEVVKHSEIVVTTTPSKSSLIKNEWLKKGLHITAMGSDAEEKNELEPLIIKNCDQYIPDSLSQTRILGELHHAIDKNIILPNENFNELGNIILDSNLGRNNKEDITVCDLTGTGVQDTAIARQTYEIAMNLKLGTNIN